MNSVSADTGLPAYARFVDDRRGALALAVVRQTLRRSIRNRVSVSMDLAATRRHVERFDAQFGSLDRATKRTAVEHDLFAAEWIDVPQAQPDRALLYFHGGAFMFRSPTVHAAMLARCCSLLGARGLMVDYRLAPEHPFPAAPDDCHTAYRWLLAQGLDPKSIVIGGDSAGANLALVTLQRINSAAEPLPACGVLLSPFADFSLSSPSLLSNEASDVMISLEAAVGLRALYAGPERYLDPDVSPLFGDFTGLPPLLLQASSTEMLLDDARRTAARADACGVPVQLEIWRGMPHVFQAMQMLPQSGAAIAGIARFIGQHTGWTAGR